MLFECICLLVVFAVGVHLFVVLVAGNLLLVVFAVGVPLSVYMRICKYVNMGLHTYRTTIHTMVKYEMYSYV